MTRLTEADVMEAIGRVPPEAMRKIEEAIQRQLDIEPSSPMS
jgi:hypothetical protein